MASPARAAALQALRLVATGDLGDVLTRTRDPLADVRDRALATDLVTGTLRWRGALDYQLARRSGKPLDRLDPVVLDVLRLGAYQLLYRERLPASAIVNDSVELVKSARLKSAAGFVNAILRRLARERDALEWPSTDNPVEHLAVVYAHPAWLVRRWLQRWGPATAEAWLRFNNVAPAITLAPNRTRITRPALAARLKEEGVECEPAPMAPHGLRVLSGRALTTQAFADGLCLVQDESSQLIPELLTGVAGGTLLDACAAPGGKTVALAAQAGSHGLVVAADVRARRTRVLKTTLERCRITNARVVQMSKSGSVPFGDEAFDGVLVDAPCSGLGTVRRDPDIKWKRTEADLPSLARAQVDLLLRLARVVKSDGRLVYSTCSSEPDENEEVVRAFLAATDEFTLLPLDRLTEQPTAVRACATREGFLRTDPARHGLEAFFAAILVRRVVR